MRLALTDVKKSVVRREGKAYLVPHLLRRADLRGELAALVSLHEEWVGHTRDQFPRDRPVEIVGDYRLARGLTTTIGDWYVWEPQAWPGPAEPHEAAALDRAGIRSASQLRLALFDAVQAACGGYLATAEREPFLARFADSLQLCRQTLDALLAIDADEQAILRRVTELPPTPHTLAARYNWRAVEAVLSAASSVAWTLPPAFAAARGTTLGTLLKNVCFLARRMGVYYDAEYAEAGQADGDEQMPRVAESRAAYGGRRELASVQERQGPISVSLYGPQEAFGGPTRYGDRLAQVCRSILGLNRPGSEHTQMPQGAVGLRGEATVYLRSQPFRVALDERLLALVLPGGEDEPVQDTSQGAPAFDSSVERLLHDEFAALERDQATHGWHLEREPEPVLCGDTILIPDFALSRGARRVYLEVAGYWSPGYRERKCRKLLALSGRVDLIVAAPDESRTAFQALEGTLPCVWYAHRPSARQLLAALASHYDDFAERRAAVGHASALAEVSRRGVVPAEALGGVLSVYDRSELAHVVADVAAAAQRAGAPEPILVDGLGLASPDWLARARSHIAGMLQERGAAIPLRELAERLSQVVPELRAAADVAAATEALARTTGFTIDREDLFQLLVHTPDDGAGQPAEESRHAGRDPQKRAQPHGSRRRKLNDGAHTVPLPWDDMPG